MNGTLKHQLEEEHVFAAGRVWTYMMSDLEVQLYCWVGKRRQANVEARPYSEQICE
jgi:hypothetical protein